MPIVSCPSCRHAKNVPDQFIGQRIRCPKCQIAFTVEILMAPPASVVPALTPAYYPLEQQMPPPPPEPNSQFANLREDGLVEKSYAVQFAQAYTRNSVAICGCLTFLWSLMTILGWFLLPATGTLDAQAGKGLLYLAMFSVAMNFCLAIATFLMALRYLFITRDWIGAASTSGAVVSFVLNFGMGIFLLITFSATLALEASKNKFKKNINAPPAKFFPDK